MADCECLARCPFFNDKMADTPAMTEVYKRKYCRGENAACARYMIFKALGPARVPADLYPHEVERARKLVAGK